MVICDVLVLLEMLLVLRQESLMHASVRLIEGAIIENLAWAHFCCGRVGRRRSGKRCHLARKPTHLCTHQRFRCAYFLRFQFGLRIDRKFGGA